MKKAAQDILNELEVLKGIIESCIKKDQVSPADYDMITDKLRSAISMAGTLHTSKPAASEADIEERIIEKLSVVIDSIIDRRMNEYRSSSVAKAAVDEVRSPEVQKEEPIADKSRKRDVKAEKPVEKKQGESKILYETIAEKNKPGKSVYDMLSKDTASPDYSSKIAGQKIPDLEKAISLNEKFVFIKELFGGNAQQYSLMVSKLNAMASIDEARNFIQSDYSWWDTKDVTVKSFLDLVKRRFL